LAGAQGKGYALNVPLQDGIKDEPYLALFKDVVGAAAERFNPSVIVMQCGANSLAGDRVGSFNLTHVAHCGAVEFVCNLETPLLLLGGGGSSLPNVSRCWARDTMIALGEDVQPSLPRSVASSSCYEYFAPTYSLDIEPVTMNDCNTPASLHAVKLKVLNLLREHVEGMPTLPSPVKRSAEAAGLEQPQQPLSKVGPGVGPV
jgi:histone deacetylase 1/2